MNRRVLPHDNNEGVTNGQLGPAAESSAPPERAPAFPMIARKWTTLALALASSASCGDATLEVVPYASVARMPGTAVEQRTCEGISQLAAH